MTCTGSYWLAYYVDWSGFRVFDSELDCLRFAVAHHMEVESVPFGADPLDAINEARKEVAALTAEAT